MFLRCAIVLLFNVHFYTSLECNFPCWEQHFFKFLSQKWWKYSEKRLSIRLTFIVIICYKKKLIFLLRFEQVSHLILNKCLVCLPIQTLTAVVINRSGK